MMKKSKFKKIAIIFLSSVLFLSLSYCIYCFFLLRGDIPYNFQEKTMLLYTKSKLSKIFGMHIKLVLDFPARFYHCKDDSIEFTKKVPKSYYFYRVMEMGTIFDADYNLLFNSGSSAFFDELEYLNKSNFLSEKEYFERMKEDNLKEKIEDMIILKRGSLWDIYNTGELSIKLYSDGDFILSYAWWDEESQEYKKKRYIQKIPINKELVKSLIDQTDFAAFEKYRSFNTFWDRWSRYSSFSTFMLKKKENVKIVYRDSTSIDIEKELEEFWDKIVELGKLKEVMMNEINKEDTIFIRKDRLKIIYDCLSY